MIVMQKKIKKGFLSKRASRIKMYISCLSYKKIYFKFCIFLLHDVIVSP